MENPWLGHATWRRILLPLLGEGWGEGGRFDSPSFHEWPHPRRGVRISEPHEVHVRHRVASEREKLDQPDDQHRFANYFNVRSKRKGIGRVFAHHRRGKGDERLEHKKA